MKRSMQEIVELVVFGLIAILVATGVLWLVGWIFGLLGAGLVWFSGLIWALLRFIVPVAVVAGIVYLVVRLVQQGQGDRTETSTYAPAPTEHAPAGEAGTSAPAAGTTTATAPDPVVPPPEPTGAEVHDEAAPTHHDVPTDPSPDADETAERASGPDGDEVPPKRPDTDGS